MVFDINRGLMDAGDKAVGGLGGGISYIDVGLGLCVLAVIIFLVYLYMANKDKKRRLDGNRNRI